jgi:hypothetical protein
LYATSHRYYMMACVDSNHILGIHDYLPSKQQQPDNKQPSIQPNQNTASLATSMTQSIPAIIHRSTCTTCQQWIAVALRIDTTD